MKSFTQLARLSVVPLLLSSNVLAYEDVLNCPLLGPLFPPASNYADSKAIQSARESFSSVLEDALKSGRLDANTTSFSIGVFASNSDESIYKHHYSAPGLNGSLTSGELNDDTIFRIGSVSKLLTVYAILVQNGDVDFNQPVTNYIQELKVATYENEVDTIDWADVTVGALAAHLAGVNRGYATYDFANMGSPEDFGFPAIDESLIPTCGVTPGNQGIPPCDRKGHLQGIISQQPIAPTFHTPIYSNTAFALLGHVLEAISGQDYSAAVNSLVTQPLGLTRTFVDTPNDTNTIQPLGPVAEFQQQLGDSAPAGALYSTLNDLNNLGRAILNSTLLSESLTRRWLKPHTHTSDPIVSVGAPWEIFRYQIPLFADSDKTRPIDLYTKGGDIGLYSTLLVLVPEQGVGFTILTAGLNAGGARDILPDLLTETFIPAFQEATREEAIAKYGGTYALESDDLNSTITIFQDDGPGLAVDITINGKIFPKFLESALGAPFPNDTMRFYYSGLGTKDRKKMTAAWSLPRSEVTSKQGIFEAYCPGWLVPTGYQYAGVALDEYEVNLGEDGKAESVTFSAFRRTLKRT